MSHPYLDSPATGVHDWPEDAECPPKRTRVHLFTIRTPKGTRCWSPQLALIQNIRASLWPPSHKTKLPRYSISQVEVRRGN